VGVVTLAVAMGFVALARPQRGMRWETMKRNGLDLLLVVDTSRSMDADDVKPSRLERAKLAIRDLVERFPGDRIGLVAFAGDAFVQSPMTLDHAALLETVDSLDTSVIPRGGTNLGRGIDVAAEALATEPDRQKVMVLLSDGEDLEGQGLAEAKQAAAAAITIDTVGVGTPAGELVPAHDAQGAAVGVVRDESGVPVRSHLDEAGLAAIARAAHGEYRALGADGGGLQRLYDESLAKLTHVEASSRTRRVYSERFQIPLGLMLLGLVADSLLGRRWRGMRFRSRRRHAVAPAVAAAAAVVLVLAVPSRAHASVESAAKSYAAGRYDDSAKEFTQQSARAPKDARLAFDAGDAAYRAGQYDVADDAFKRAVPNADPRLQQRALYNDGDVLYRSGEALKPEAREQTIAKWKAAVEAYDGAIALDPGDVDARYNRDFVQRKLAALEQKQKEQPKDDKKDKPGSQSDKKDQSGSQSDKKDQPGSQGDKKEQSGSQGDKPGVNQGGQGPTPEQGAKNGPSGANPTPAGAGRVNEAQVGDGSQRQAQEPTRPGQLSAREARALLGALRGEERHGLSHRTAGAPPTDDSPRKDW
jgi:Ca-activated chloride channel family protein